LTGEKREECAGAEMTSPPFASSGTPLQMERGAREYVAEPAFPILSVTI